MNTFKLPKILTTKSKLVKSKFFFLIKLTGNSAQQQSLIQRGNIGETSTTATSAIGPHNSGMISAKSLVTAPDQMYRKIMQKLF